jgi:hypothetical protein
MCFVCSISKQSMAHALEARDTPVLEICCRVVGNLALHSQENQTILRQGDACAMVCECLRRWVPFLPCLLVAFSPNVL